MPETALQKAPDAALEALGAASRLAARLGYELPADAPLATWLERLATNAAPADTLAIVEHAWGALALRDLFAGDEPAWDTALSGETSLDLGLFTPGPSLRWHGIRLDATRQRDGVTVSGRVRHASAPAVATIVPIVLDGENRLALVPVPAADNNGWVSFDDTPALAISAPVEDTILSERLGVYATRYALAAAHLAARAARATRRALRLNEHGGTKFNSAQRLTFDLTALEIETDLLVAATAQALDPSTPGDGLRLALGASRSLQGVCEHIARLEQQTGVQVEWSASAASLAGFLGGVLMLESELGAEACSPAEVDS